MEKGLIHCFVGDEWVLHHLDAVKQVDELLDAGQNFFLGAINPELRDELDVGVSNLG